MLSLGAGAAKAQTQALPSDSYVTDYGGFWRSGTGLNLNYLLNSTLPDSSHQLLAFTVDGKRYATGVNNALLGSRGLAYANTQYQALPVTALSSTITGNIKIGLGQLYDLVDNGPRPTTTPSTCPMTPRASIWAPAWPTCRWARSASPFRLTKKPSAMACSTCSSPKLPRPMPWPTSASFWMPAATPWASP